MASHSSIRNRNRKEEKSSKNLDSVSWGRADYFKARSAKLAAQAPKRRSGLFSGLTFYFTGVKSHSQMKLSRDVWKHGGHVLPMWERRKITHVVADNLASAKINKELEQIGSASAWKGAVVKPEWVVESIRRKKREPVGRYSVITDSSVKDIRSFFGQQKPTKNGTKKTKNETWAFRYASKHWLSM